MKKKKNVIKEKEQIIFNNNVRITRDINDNIIFETKDLVTTDLLEGIILCMCHENINDKYLWSLPIFEVDFYNIDALNALYWLSGGDSEWMCGETYTKKWNEVYQSYEDKYAKQLMDDILQCENFKNIRDVLNRKYNITYMYDFALSLKIIKGW